MCADSLRGGSTVGGYEIVTTKEVPMIFRVDSNKLQYSQDNGITWIDCQFTGGATAAAAHILSGYTAYVNGTKITGTIPSKAAATITPKTTNQTIAAGTYLSGTQTIAGDADLVAANILAGKNIFNVAGTAKRQASGTTTGTVVAATLGWLARYIIVIGVNGAAFYSYNSWTNAVDDGYGVITNYTYNTLVSNPTASNSAYNEARVGTWTTTGFSLTLTYGATMGTLSWYAFE